ncbi:MAG: LL-diaminopimelate aminotransferase [Clostridia bacterium]|nr:LL-diaminopimelate aminotransferase [Clostridia bacterium]
MIEINKNYLNIKKSYLFAEVNKRSREYLEAHPDEKLLILGVGDITQPLCDSVISALHSAVDDQSKKESFHGYMPECGSDEFRTAVVSYYKKFGVNFEKNEVFVSSGALDELGDILKLFSDNNSALVPEPAYPAYVETNIISGHRVIHLPALPENGFTALPDYGIDADIIYLCSPNNPTGAAYSYDVLSKWVEYAKAKKSIIIFDAAYESFIVDRDIPHSIFELEGSRQCCIEICSLSKTAGFTGMRCGYTVIPNELVFDGISLNALWTQNRTTITNGVSYVLQKAGAAALSEEGQRQTKQAVKIYQKNAEVLTKALDECKITYYGGKNSPYIWMRCPNDMNSWDFFDFLLNKAQIVGTPGAGFGECGNYYFRLSAFGDPEDTVLAGERIKDMFK